MRKDPGLVFRFFLILGDSIAIIAAFLFAYLFRTHLDNRPYYFESEPLNFTITIAFLVPIWIIILASMGLYRKEVFFGKSYLTESSRLFFSSIIGVMTIITYDFFGQNNLFPVRLVAVYATILCFIFLSFVRFIIKFIRQLFLKKNHGAIRAIVIGNHKNTEYLLEHIHGFPEDGYVIAAIISSGKYIPKGLKKYQYSSLKEALKKVKADVIFQTDEHHTEYVYRQSIYHHLLYYFVPSNVTMSSHISHPELIGSTPAILVKATPLIGGAKVAKRLMDLIISIIIIIPASIIMLIIYIIQKLLDFKSPATYSQIRLSRYNKKFKIYKFRSMKPEFSCMSPEEAFIKIKKPHLIKQYRKNGDFIENDPRITKFGKFLRSTSLDELPQLFNVIKGDISLVGPRALVPGELKNYGDRSLLLSVKSGLTGLAQVSGRRDISFEERRALDIYYIQNWSIYRDFQILFRTLITVLFQKGAK